MSKALFLGTFSCPQWGCYVRAPNVFNLGEVFFGSSRRQGGLFRRFFTFGARSGWLCWLGWTPSRPCVREGDFMPQKESVRAVDGVVPFDAFLGTKSNFGSYFTGLRVTC